MRENGNVLNILKTPEMTMKMKYLVKNTLSNFLILLNF